LSSPPSAPTTEIAGLPDLDALVQVELSVVAESVETAVQVERLAALGCEEAQGWYFAPALAAEATAARVADPVFRPEA
jgi:EAL domain-containing protein (putative c-di-GMP-specific phosphodiesterase class I)